MTSGGIEPRTERLRRARHLRAYLVQVPYLLVLLAGLVAAVLVLFDRWRRGAFVFGSALLLASLLRALIPTSRAGLLQVRGRFFDVVATAAVGATILWLATSIDPLGTD
ncbi:DUF3017 domain-containing protein [Gordonia soli]|uniref:DUF3017 domain-containing protein n=1 Tax=Gordonia soli NBRC 108243 TaxID=1223545 RepID=M0QMG6_9ACTN|nr:DUF3017 domain-containing protein [Gordonia soli]GAC69845.1 hypothetical protein GS4_28_00930 [Gordonia soli NBRC 108243]